MNNYNKTRTTITSVKDKRKGTEVKCADIRNFFNKDTKRKEQIEVILIGDGSD